MSEPAFQKHLDLLPKLGQQKRKAITDAAAIAAYHTQIDWPMIDALICDTAPQFSWWPHWRMLCWVHEGCPYKKLMPIVPLHREMRDKLLKRFWGYYHEMR